LKVVSGELKMKRFNSNQTTVAPLSLRCQGSLPAPNLVLLLGNNGTGKTDLALTLGLAACQRRHRVRFTTASA
jgi:DNA replication protein DnaC